MPDKYTLTGMVLVGGVIIFFLVTGLLTGVQHVPAGEQLDGLEVSAHADILRCRYLTIEGIEERIYWDIPVDNPGNLPCPIFLRD